MSGNDEDWAGAADAQEKALKKVGNLSLNGSGVPDLPDDGGDVEDTTLSAAEISRLRKVISKGLVENTHTVEIERKDPTSPLYSVKSFEELNLDPKLLKGVYAMGFNRPSKIQETALPMLLADPPQNMIAQSQSGTGKTAAFVLAMLSRVNPEQKWPQVLCLCPTYELAIQIGEVVDNMAQFYPDIKIRYAVRGEMLDRNTKLQEHIIIGTPGKVLDWSSLKFKFFDLKKIRVFVLDEADVMIGIQGHQDQSIRIHQHLPSDCQMLLFSATYDQDVMDFAENIVTNPVLIKLRREEESLDNIKQYYVYCETIEAKYRSIRNIYGTITIGQAIIFCHTRKTANWLANELKGDGHALSVLTGDQTPDERITVLDRYRQGLEKILITTNVLSRGIDIEQVTIVVNFDLPVDQEGKADCETYLHRIGRTGRFGKTGLAINLVDSPKSMAVMKEIEKHFGKDIHKLDAEDVDEIEKIEK